MALVTGIIRMSVCDAKAALRLIRQADLSAQFLIGGQAHNPMVTLQKCIDVVEGLERMLNRIMSARTSAQESLVYDDLSVFLTILAESSLLLPNSTDPLRDTRKILTFLGEQCAHLIPIRGGYIGQCLKTLEMLTGLLVFQNVASDFYIMMQQSMSTQPNN